MLGQPSNQMLAQAEQGIQSKLPQAMQQDLQKVLHAGMTILYSPQLQGQLQQRIKTSADPIKDASEGAARLISNLYQQSNKTMPTALIVPAAMIFAFEYLDLVQKAGKIQITPQMISQTTTAVGDTVLPLFGMTKDKLAALIAHAKQNPQGAPQAAPQAAPTGILGSAQGAQ